MKARDAAKHLTLHGGGGTSRTPLAPNANRAKVEGSLGLCPWKGVRARSARTSRLQPSTRTHSHWPQDSLHLFKNNFMGFHFPHSMSACSLQRIEKLGKNNKENKSHPRPPHERELLPAISNILPILSIIYPFSFVCLQEWNHPAHYCPS